MPMIVGKQNFTGSWGYDLWATINNAIELIFRWTLNRLGLDSNFAANKERTHGRHKLVGDMIVRIFWDGKMIVVEHHEVKGI